MELMEVSVFRRSTGTWQCQFVLSCAARSLKRSGVKSDAEDVSCWRHASLTGGDLPFLIYTSWQSYRAELLVFRVFSFWPLSFPFQSSRSSTWHSRVTLGVSPSSSTFNFMLTRSTLAVGESTIAELSCYCLIVDLDSMR